MTSRSVVTMARASEARAAERDLEAAVSTPRRVKATSTPVLILFLVLAALLTTALTATGLKPANAHLLGFRPAAMDSSRWDRTPETSAASAPTNVRYEPVSERFLLRQLVREEFERCTTGRGLTVEPAMGSVLIWYNHDIEGYTNFTAGGNGGEAGSETPATVRGDPRVWHGSCDVTSGVKWAANYWIHGRDFKLAMASGCDGRQGQPKRSRMMRKGGAEARLKEDAVQRARHS